MLFFLLKHHRKDSNTNGGVENKKMTNTGNSNDNRAMGYVVQAGFCMIVLMALMIGGLLTGCVFAQRVSTVSRLNKVHDDVIFALP